MFFQESKIIKLIGRFTGTIFYDEENYQELSYSFDILTLSDCENGEIRGCELLSKTVFKTHFDCSLEINAYRISELDMNVCTKKQLEEIKYFRLSKKEQKFLNSLREGEIITFWARIPNSIFDDPYSAYSCFCTWDFERCKDKKIVAKFESLLNDIGIYPNKRKQENLRKEINHDK